MTMKGHTYYEVKDVKDDCMHNDNDKYYGKEDDDNANDEDKVPRGVAGVALASGVGGTAPCSGNCRGGSLRHCHVNYCDSSKLVMIMLYEISPLLLFIIFKPPEIRSWTCGCWPH